MFIYDITKAANINTGGRIVAIFFVSDTHLTVGSLESKSLFPRHLDRLPRKEAEELYERMRVGIDNAFESATTHIAKQPKADAIIHLGDVTGGYRESGCAHPLVRPLAEDCRNTLHAIAPTYFALGNHDVGYRHPGSLGRGISVESIETCEEIFGDLYWALKVNGTLFIGVCSSIIEYGGNEERIVKRARTQHEFVGDTLGGGNEKWVFCIHNPFSSRFLAREIVPHLDRLGSVVCGEFHDPTTAKPLRAITKMASPFFRGAKGKVLVKCLQKLRVCPSTAPLWWRGYGLLQAVEEHRELEYEEVFLPLPSRAPLPTASRLRSTVWMVR